MIKIKIPNSTDKHVGARMRMRRMMLNMSQSALGKALGITFQQIQKYEKGINRVSASRLQQLSEALQVRVPFFFEGAPLLEVDRNSVLRSATSNGVSEFMATRDGLALAKAFVRIDNIEVRRQIVGLVADLAQRDAEA